MKGMRAGLMVLMCTLAPLVACGQTTVNINYDKKTVAAMAECYAAEAMTEAYYNEQVQKVLSHYGAAEVAAAGIFASKYLDRKGLTELGIWSDATENYYYRRIYKLVRRKILPKVWTVAGLMLKSPQTALWWGSYLMKVCTETKALCMQMESVVMNSKLGFGDIAFLEVRPEVQQLLKLTEAGGGNWKETLEGLGNVGSGMTKESLKADVEKLYQMGVGLASAGTENAMQQLMQGSNFSGTMMQQAASVANVVENGARLWESLDSSVGGTLLALVGGEEGVAQLFNVSEYNMTSWMTDYARERMGQYYTQRWKIVRKDAGSEVLCDYTPPTDKNSIVSGGEYVRYNAAECAAFPNSEQRKEIWANTGKYAGWTEEKVVEANAAGDGCKYTLTYGLYAYTISKNNVVTKRAFAYAIKVTKSWDNTEVVHEELFDSYTMDEATMEARMNAMLSEWNDNEEGYLYTLERDAKNYYQTTDAKKMAGCEAVVLSVTCSDGTTLLEGTTQYKCKKCGSSVNAHTKECAMKTTLEDNEIDTSELDALEAEYTEQAKALVQKMQMLQAELTRTQSKLPYATDEEKVALQRQYDKVSEEMTKTMAEYNAVKEKLEELEQAREEAATDNEVETDDYYRIPAIMQDCKTTFGLTWKGDGQWSGNTYIREATTENIKGVVTFSATLTIARKPKYFLGIKIHRAIVNIAWKLTAEYSDTQVVEVVQLESSLTDEEKAKVVNAKIAEVAQTYPDCTVSTEYIRSEAVEDDATEETYHLLWSSDRLEIARQVDVRLTQIYADLVSLEKMMHYKLSIVDVLKRVAPHVDDTQGKRKSLSEEAISRWRNAGKR